MTEGTAKFFLLQVNDALFPIGGYSHSYGLETYIQKGIVHDEDSARFFPFVPLCIYQKYYSAQEAPVPTES